MSVWAKTRRVSTLIGMEPRIAVSMAAMAKEIPQVPSIIVVIDGRRDLKKGKALTI